MNYTVNLMDKTSIELTESEFSTLMSSPNPIVHFPRLNRGVNKMSISTYGPSDEVDRSQQKLGVLHDGSPVVRQFGIWYDANSPKDEQGRYTVTLDPTYYPEASRDCVPTPEEYERNYKSIPSGQDRLSKMLGTGEPRKVGTTDGFERIGAGREAEA